MEPRPGQAQVHGWCRTALGGCPPAARSGTNPKGVGRGAEQMGQYPGSPTVGLGWIGARGAIK
jgi:hypothetical protein